MKRRCWRLATSVGCAALICGASSAFGADRPATRYRRRASRCSATRPSPTTGTSTVSGDVGRQPRQRDHRLSSWACSCRAPSMPLTPSRSAAQNADATRLQRARQPGGTADLTGQDLGGLDAHAGRLLFVSVIGVLDRRRLTLDAQGNAGAVFIFKTGSTITTASGSSSR